jgi:hypothetical protein
MNDMLVTLFERQLELQRSAFGVDPSALPLEDRVAYIDYNMTALIQEIAEARDEIAWKPWADDHLGFINEPECRGEMVDVLHFFVNIMLALDVTPDVLLHLYLDKRAVNAARQAEGYSHHTQKCGTCGRALDEPGKS